MKLNKYLATALLLLPMGFMTSCSDDDNLAEAPRLFTPVPELVQNRNSIEVSWKQITGATQYDLTLYKLTGTDEAGENTYEVYSTATCTESPYTFTDLEWDEKYNVAIHCSNATKESRTLRSSDATITYPTSLKSVKTIDNAARVSWDLGGNEIRAILAISEEGDTVVKTLSSAQYQTGEVDIVGLQPSTKYVFRAFSDTETYNNDTYAGRMNGTTTKAIDFDTEYGAGMWLDIRDYDDKMAKDTLKTAEFWEQVQDGMTIVLRGDFDYKVNNSIAFDKSVRFTTAATLGGNARFVASGGMTLAKNVTVDFVEFNNVDFISDKAMPEGGNEIATNTDKGFGGRQVFNINGVNSTLTNLTFKGCHIEGFRAVVRAQKDNDNITNIVMEDCFVNGIGDQGVFTTTNKLGDWQLVSIKNCTFTNIVLLCDFRATANALTMNIDNCTFCYAPIETTANKNTPLFRFMDNQVTLNVNNTIFGPSMATDGSAGDAVQTNTAGKAGSIMIDANNALVTVSKSFKTKFDWTAIKEVTYPLDNLNSLTIDETELWKDPAGGDFHFKTPLDEANIGDARWQ